MNPAIKIRPDRIEDTNPSNVPNLQDLSTGQVFELPSLFDVDSVHNPLAGKRAERPDVWLYDKSKTQTSVTFQGLEFAASQALGITVDAMPLQMPYTAGSLTEEERADYVPIGRRLWARLASQRPTEDLTVEHGIQMLGLHRFDSFLATPVEGHSSQLLWSLEALGKTAPNLRSELEGLLSLPVNWDLEGGRPATKAATIAAAKAILKVFNYGKKRPVLTSLSAAVDGGIEMTWEGTRGQELFMVIPPNGRQLRYVHSERSAQSEYRDSGGILDQDSGLESLLHELVA